MEKKKQYLAPTLKIVEFQVEVGFAGSLTLNQDHRATIGLDAIIENDCLTFGNSATFGGAKTGDQMGVGTENDYFTTNF